MLLLLTLNMFVEPPEVRNALRWRWSFVGMKAKTTSGKSRVYLQWY